MKENKYNNEEFFDKYSEMNRSKYGLSAAGEWHELKDVLPNLHNKKVLDLGCGYGWHCIYALENGANFVVGIDISQRMLDIAKEKTNYNNIEYSCCAMEDVDYPDESFDIIISSLAFHYVKDYQKLIINIARMLIIGGTLVFTVEHPVFTSNSNQDWIYDDEGNIMYFPVDNYFDEEKRNTMFLGEDVTKYHRTITTYLNTLLDNQLTINKVIEPKPPKEMMDVPGMKDELRRPMMLIVAVTKKDNMIKK